MIKRTLCIRDYQDRSATGNTYTIVKDSLGNSTLLLNTSGFTYNSITGITNEGVIEHYVTGTTGFTSYIAKIPLLFTQTIDDIGYYNPLIEDWAPNTPYKTNNIVQYDNNSYKCVTTHTGGTSFNITNWTKTPTGTSEYSVTITGDTKIEQFRRYGKTDIESDLYNPIWNTGFTQTIQASNGLKKQIIAERDNLNEISLQKLYDYKIWMNNNTGATLNYSDIDKDNSIITYDSLGLSNSNAIESPGVKLDYLMGVIEPPKINIDVFIDRGSNSSFDSHIRLGEIKSLKDLESYGNGYYKIKEN